MKKLSIAFLMILLAACSGGGNAEIHRYAKEQLRLPHIRITDITELTDEYGHTDIRFTALTDAGLVFHILRDVTEGFDGETTYYRDDLQYAGLAAKKDHFHALQVRETEDDQGMLYAELYGMYDSRQGLEEMCRELQEFSDGSILVNAHMVFKDSTEIYMQDADFQNAWSLFTETDADEVMDRFMHAAAEECRHDILQEFDGEEVSAYIAANEHRIVSGDESAPVTQPDLIGNANFHGLSFACVYELMKRDGCLLEGTPEQFSFAGTDGYVISVSMDRPEVITSEGAEYVLQNPGHIRTIELRVLTGRFYAEQYELDRGWDLLTD